jgi:hypothetical protein
VQRELKGESVALDALPLPMSPFGETPLARVLCEPAGRYAMIQCFVLREHDRTGLRYDLYLELPPFHALYCMSARKIKASRTSLFRIASDRHATDVSSPAYLGKLKATDVGGLSWTLYSPGLSPRNADKLAGGSSASSSGRRSSRRSDSSVPSSAGGDKGDGDDDDESVQGGGSGGGSQQLREERLCITFEKSILGSGGPTQLCAVMPAETEEGGRAGVRPRSKAETLLERSRAHGKNGLTAMTNKVRIAGARERARGWATRPLALAATARLARPTPARAHAARGRRAPSLRTPTRTRARRSCRRSEGRRWRDSRRWVEGR